MTTVLLYLGLPLLAVYAAFLWWYGGGRRRPLSPTEIDDLLARIAATDSGDHDPALIAGLRRLADHDDGRPFVMQNLIRYRPAALYPPGHHYADMSAPAADRRYGRLLLPHLLRVGSLPVFIGKRSGDFVSADGERWQVVAMVRYRSRRDFLRFALAIARRGIDVHKWAAIERTEIFPVRPFIDLFLIRSGLAALLLAVLLAAAIAVDLTAPAPRSAMARRCADGTAPAGPWYPSVAPSETGNGSDRSHLYPAACTAMTAGAAAAQSARAGALRGAYNAVTGPDGAVFVLAGAFGAIEASNRPFIAGLDGNLQERWRTGLPGLTPAHWNYPGVIGLHGNGDLYVVYGPRVARIDPADGRLKAVADLPVNQPAVDVAYNGFVLLKDGTIATKSIHRAPGCTAPDFQAFVACDPTAVAPSTLALIDPDTLAVRQTEITPEPTRFRATATVLDGVEYLYLPGETAIFRYGYQAGRLTRDDGWRPRYLDPGQTAATATAGFGDWLIAQTNGTPAATPMAIVAISQRDPARQFRIRPFAGRADGGGSFIPSMPTVDADNARIYTFDGFVGEAAALSFDPVRGFSVAWRVAQRSFAFSALVGPKDARVWVGTDLATLPARLAFAALPFELRRRLIGFNARPPLEDLVWRDAASGRELGRAPRVAAVAGGVPAPTAGGGFLAPDLAGATVVRVDATR